MISINKEKRVNAKELHAFVGVKTRFTDWIKRSIEYADLKKDKDFYSVLSIGKHGGRPTEDYELTIDAAKEICLVSSTPKGKELRRWLITLSSQKENLELLTIKEAAFAVKVINCLKYIDNQKEALSLHQKQYFAKNGINDNQKYIYSEFAQYRSRIVGWDKVKIDEALNKYIDTHSGHNRTSLMKSNTQTKLSVMDVGEAIRVAVLDILYSKDTDSQLASNFSIMCKNLANEMKIEAEKTNTSNLFREQENIESVKNLKLTI